MQNDPGSKSTKLLYIEEWAIDALDRLQVGDIRGAKTSLSYANLIVMQMPPGSSYEDLEAFLHTVGVKLYQTADESHQTHENRS